MEYQIVTENDPHSMASSVNYFCKEGWVPFGSPMVAATTKESWFHYQAMVRSDNKEDLQNKTQQLKDPISDLRRHLSNVRTAGLPYGDSWCENIKGILAKLESI